MFIIRIGILLIFICTGWVCKEYSTGWEWAYERRESFHPGGVYWNYIRYNSTLVACIGIPSDTIPPWWPVLELHQVQFHPCGVYWNYIRYNSNLVACIGITSDSTLVAGIRITTGKIPPCGVNWNYNMYNSTLVACIEIPSGTIPPWRRALELHQVQFYPGGVYWNHIRENSTVVACIGITSGTILP